MPRRLALGSVALLALAAANAQGAEARGVTNSAPAADAAAMIQERWPGLLDPARSIDRPNAILEALLEAHRTRGFSATYKESKHLALLNRPLTSSGILVYQPERGLYRRMEAPFRQEMIITPDSMFRRDEHGRVEPLSGGGDAFTASLRDAMLGLFAGSWKEMRLQFTVAFMPHDDAWVMILQPNNKRLAKVVHALVLQGREQRLTDLWVVEQNGNWTHDTFTERTPVDGEEAGWPKSEDQGQKTEGRGPGRDDGEPTHVP